VAINLDYCVILICYMNNGYVAQLLRCWVYNVMVLFPG
jgi:hypothetical protein